ncbi:MAG TPA: glycoside hydrolase family 3 N-terminal domain-containing protein [Mobilitalea sp.]|nr:glycoside hydrolase family 3 N-terminal domain-containing protein [Mobilitalea sp.]
MPEVYKNSKFSARERAENLISFMTLKEKIGQLNQRLYGFSIYERHGDEILLSDEFKEEVGKYSGLGVLYGLFRADPWSGRDYENGLYGNLAIKAYNMVQKYVIEHSRLGIPMLLSSECPHGHQALDGYLLPVNLCSGASFHPKLLERAYEVCGEQLKSLGVNLALVSLLDVLRDPRWGRSEECYSEDPYLVSEFAKAVVTGLQKKGVAAVAKHFCAQGEGTGGINASAARIGERELREIHLPPAKACITAGTKGIMAAYNEIDGIPCHSNKKLLTGLLREEMGFEGFVMSDGIAIDQLELLTGDRVKSGAIALKAGVDIGLWDTAFGHLEEAYEGGLVTMEEIDRAVLHVLAAKFEQGLFEHPYLDETEEDISFDYNKYPEALELARESIVLLKNSNNILPIKGKNIHSIAVIGPNADAIYNQLGDYTPPVRAEAGVTVLKGIRQYIKEHDVEIEVKTHRVCDSNKGSDQEIKEAVELAGSSDLVVLVLGGTSSRFGRAEFDGNGAAIVSNENTMDCGEGVDSARLELPESQLALARAVFDTGKKVISILIQGRPYAITDIANQSEGLLCCFYPGMMGGKAIAEILFGKISPSGRLPVSIPRHSGQLPVYYNYKTSYAAMNYYDLEKQPLYSFGYGLSYTDFQYSNIRLDRTVITTEQLDEEGITLRFELTNTGEMDSYAVPQLYLRDLQASTVRRIRELKAFDKIWVPRGKSVNGYLCLNKDSLSLWNDEMMYQAEPGEFEVILSDNGKDIWKGRFLFQ